MCSVGDAGGEAAKTRSEIDDAGEIGNPKAFLALRLVAFECLTGEGNALVVKLPFFLAQGDGAF